MTPTDTATIKTPTAVKVPAIAPGFAKNPVDAVLLAFAVGEDPALIPLVLPGPEWLDSAPGILIGEEGSIVDMGKEVGSEEVDKEVDVELVEVDGLFVTV